MKISTAVVVALALCSTSALAFQEKPSPEIAVQSSGSTKSTAISRFSGDENDGAIVQAYGPGTFTSTQTTENGYPVPAPRHQRQ
ncbi:MAG TPA: hypothetical protein VH187_08940 [Scandinavium sp.]|jgi:exo-beta-1,3-glucanase (GH17 family)|uniref:hypothetical protein n=1 Tax=Scandinavium sp. TaxID=2830653 RepID=UPI002E36B98B|nr:hypothetical protein [Scandinavium sp.]HEX4501273.1 hypothetical protein [Scandinavium sp.]